MKKIILLSLLSAVYLVQANPLAEADKLVDLNVEVNIDGEKAERILNNFREQVEDLTDEAIETLTDTHEQLVNFGGQVQDELEQTGQQIKSGICRYAAFLC